MSFFILFILMVLDALASVYTWIVIISVVFNWLIVFNIFNSRHFFVKIVTELLSKLTDPVLDRIRQFVPFVGGVDLSPFILIVMLSFVQGIVGRAILEVG